MEQNVQLIARRVWHVVRVAFFMARRSINKKKLLLELKYLTLKRHKLAAGKSLAGKLTLHHHQHNHHPHGGAYEFSCSNTPNHPIFFPFCKHGKRAHHHKQGKSHAHERGSVESEMHAVNKVLEMMVSRNDDVESSPCPFSYSPVLPGFGFGRSPAVRQLRVTDSPYYDPYQGEEEEGEIGNFKVDEAAEEFITRFYAQLM